MIQLVSADDLAAEVKAFLIDRQARGLSRHTALFYQQQLRRLADFLAQADVTDVLSVTPNHLRRHLLALGETHNPNGIHAAYRAFRAFFNWYETEVEPDDWRNPVHEVEPPRVPVEPLEPIPLANLKVMLDACERGTCLGDRGRASDHSAPAGHGLPRVRVRGSQCGRPQLLNGRKRVPAGQRESVPHGLHRR